jgi:ankyrin repeat protein
MLIDAGADISALDANGDTAADLAERLNQRAMHELLIQAAIDSGDITPLIQKASIWQGHPAIQSV